MWLGHWGACIGRMSKGVRAEEEQDLVVIGAGPGGYVAAIKAGQLGKKARAARGMGMLEARKG